MDLYQFNIQHLASGLNLDHSRQPSSPNQKSARKLFVAVFWKLSPPAEERKPSLMQKEAGKKEKKSETSKKTVCDWIKTESETSIHLPDKHIYSPLPSQALVPSGHSIGAGGSYLKGRSGGIGSKKLCCSPRPLKPGQRDPH